MSSQATPWRAGLGVPWEPAAHVVRGVRQPDLMPGTTKAPPRMSWRGLAGPVPPTADRSAPGVTGLSAAPARRPIARPAALSGERAARSPSDCSAGALHHAGTSSALRPIARPARSVAPRDPSASRPIARSVRLEPPCPVRSPSDCSAGAPPGTCASSDASRSLGRSPRGTPRGPGRRSLAGPNLGTRPRCPVTRRKPWFPAASDVPESPPGRSPLPVT